MVQRRRSTLSFRPKTSHLAPPSAAAADSLSSPSATTSSPRPPKRTQSQVFDQPDHAHHHHVPHAKHKTSLSMNTTTSSHSRRQSTIQGLEIALEQVKQMVKSASHRTRDGAITMAGSSSGPSRRQEVVPAVDTPAYAPSPDIDVPDDHVSSSLSNGLVNTISQSSIMPKRWASARRSLKKFRRPAVSGPANDRWNPVPPPSLVGPPYINFTAGNAARESANQLNHANMNMFSRSLSKLSSPGAQPSETDSVIGDDQCQLVAPLPPKMGTSSPAAAPKRTIDTSTDFVALFPREIAEQVFSFLDAASLTTCERVSRSWSVHASSRHVWRTVFTRRYGQRIHVDPPPLQMGGVGAGSVRPNQDWKKMYNIRKTIERRWSSSRPAAIYFNGHTDSVYCCQFDEDKIITGSRDRTIRVWDLKTYKCLRVIGGPDSRPQPNTPQPLEVKRVYTEHNQPSVNGTPEGQAIFHQPKFYHEASILCLQFDDEIVVTGSSDSSCIVWDIKTWEPKWQLRAHDAGVLDVCFDSRYIVSCSKDNHICIWDRNTGELIKKLHGHRGPVNAVQMRGDLLVSASGDGAAMLWNLKTGVLVKELRSGDRGLAAVEFSDDAKYVLAGGNDQTVYKFDVATGEVVRKYTGHTGLVRSLFLDTPNSRVLSGSYDQSIRVYDYNTGDEISVYDNWTTSWILSAKSDYRRIVATSQDGRALLLDFGYGISDVELLAGSR
ncbi:F-box/WD repeat-containing protein lin-23 [Phyllosticta citricarpa]|uniref:F-box/WD repeat-containing protein lin-23 n=2 Tax=Phyllosticta TaxID=121621 RepID=A0ABR1ME71_9PEZI